MGLIVEECPRCKRLTRCVVTERRAIFGGLIFGIPMSLPISSVQCVCGQCGHEFRSRSMAEERAVPAGVAADLDDDALLGLSNPELQQTRILSELRTDPRLQNAFVLLDRLSPGPLRFGLKSALTRWRLFGEPDRAELLGQVEACAQAEEFARVMARRYPFGMTGCLLGAAVAASLWIAAWYTLDKPGILGWALVAVIGLAAGGIPDRLLSTSRDRSWIRGVLLPEAERAHIPLEWVLAIIEKSSAPRGVGDEYESLRDIAPALRAELAGSDKSFGGEFAGFEPFVGDHHRTR